MKKNAFLPAITLQDKSLTYINIHKYRYLYECLIMFISEKSTLPWIVFLKNS